MAEQSILPQGISFDTTGDESELIRRLNQNHRMIMVLKDKELMEKQKEFFEKVREIYLAKFDGNRELEMPLFELLRAQCISDVDFSLEKFLDENQKIGDFVYDSIRKYATSTREQSQQQLLQEEEQLPHIPSLNFIQPLMQQQMQEQQQQLLLQKEQEQQHDEQ